MRFTVVDMSLDVAVGLRVVWARSYVIETPPIGELSESIEDKTEEPDRCPFDFTLGIIED